MNKTLLILAAGMGSRFGGLKQLEPVGPNGEFIIDYSIYDAIRNGFNKVVFVIKEVNYQIFRDTIGKRIENVIKVEYVFQSINDLPDGYSVIEREKPWGTGQAVLCAKNVINEPFVIINADDFYGNDAYKVISNFIDNNKIDNNYALVGYKVVNTLTENGSVKRGICITNNNELLSINECKIEKVNDKIIAESLINNEKFDIESNTLVSMNMIAFNTNIFKYLEDNFKIFLNKNINNLTSEYLIPEVLKKGIEEHFCNVTLLSTTSKWAGVTYKEDKPSVVDFINNEIENGIYPNKLWK